MSDMKYPDDTNGDVFRRMDSHKFDFSKEHIVDFHAVFATEEMANKIALMYLADHKAGDKFTNIETKPYDKGGMELTISKKMVVSYESVTLLESKFADRVSLVAGYLDGWGVMQD